MKTFQQWCESKGVDFEKMRQLKSPPPPKKKGVPEKKEEDPRSNKKSMWYGCPMKP